MATKLLDANKDGNILDDLMNIFGKVRKKWIFDDNSIALITSNRDKL